jgi:hypothetical protein
MYLYCMPCTSRCTHANHCILSKTYKTYEVSCGFLDLVAPCFTVPLKEAFAAGRTREAPYSIPRSHSLINRLPGDGLLNVSTKGLPAQ